MKRKDKPNSQIPHSFFIENQKNEINKLQKKSTLNSFDFIGNIIGLKSKDNNSLTDSKLKDFKPENMDNSQFQPPNTCQTLVDSSAMLFTISRKVFLEDDLDQPRVHTNNRNRQRSGSKNHELNKLENIPDKPNGKLITISDINRDTETITNIQSLNGEEIGATDHSPLFVKSDVSNSILEIQESPPHPSVVMDNSEDFDTTKNSNKSILAPIRRKTGEVPKFNLNGSISSIRRNTDRIESSLNWSVEGSKCGKPRFVPSTSDQSVTENRNLKNNSFQVEIHDSKKIARKKGSGNENTNKKWTSLSARLSRFRSKNQDEEKTIPNDNNLIEPVPIQVEDLRNSGWMANNNQNNDVLSDTSDSSNFFSSKRATKSAIRQLQLEEINEKSPTHETLEEEDKSVTLNDEILNISHSIFDEGLIVEDTKASYEDENSERSRWMDKLPSHLKKIPLNYMFIPGSHDSFSYSLEWGSTGPDVPQSIRILSTIMPCLAKSGFMRWSVTQRASLKEQLKNGIRYFDIRVAEKKKTFYFVHGLYGAEIKTILEEISIFLLSHPGEVCLLDFQHLYNFKSDSHERLKALIKSVFKDRLCPYESIVGHINLNYMEEYKYQVLVFYRSASEHLDMEFSLWPSDSLPNPWPQTTDVEKMLDFIANKIQERNSNKFFVTQCVMTPSSTYVLSNLRSSLEVKMARPANRAALAALPNFANREGGANVIMADFIEFEDYALPRAIINKNFELYPE